MANAFILLVIRFIQMNFTIEDVARFSKHFATCHYDAAAIRSLHFQAGSFCWSDELPDVEADSPDASIMQFIVFLLSYRKVLMYREQVAEFQPLWAHLQECCPQWPGFRRERRSTDLVDALEFETDREWSRLERAIDLCNAGQHANEETKLGLIVTATAYRKNKANTCLLLASGLVPYDSTSFQYNLGSRRIY